MGNTAPFFTSKRNKLQMLLFMQVEEYKHIFIKDLCVGVNYSQFANFDISKV